MRIIGHRGAMGVEPENTLRSFRRAQRDGADEIELDIRLSADGALIVMHDATVERTTNGSGEVAALTLDALRSLDAGHGERIPTYPEVLEAVDLPIQTEVKAAEAVIPFAALVTEHQLGSRITATSAHPEILAALAVALPAVDRALILARPGADAAKRADQLGARWLAGGISGLTTELMAECGELGLLVDAWPVPDAATLRRAILLGAQAVTTDYPHVLRDWLDADG